MQGPFISSIPLREFSLCKKLKHQRSLASFDLEITARCNNNCRHCCINLPSQDKKARQKELSIGEIRKIVDQAVDLGALWCLVTGGEPLLRDDFSDIYLYLKKKGLLVSVFTNATLITEKHAELFKKHPPRDIEVTVYGVTEKTYEKVARTLGAFGAFRRGLDILLQSGIKVRFKAMALRSNVHELPEISEFCRKKTKDYFRFDPFLNLRYDADESRNEEIRSERLSAREIVAIEQADFERFQCLKSHSGALMHAEPASGRQACHHLFHCGAGINGFDVGFDGILRLCPSLWHADCLYDLKKGSVAEAWGSFVAGVRALSSDKKEFLEKCCSCPIKNLCMWCPAHSHLETGELDEPVEYFCAVAHARADSLKESLDGSDEPYARSKK